ncbi:DJ-1 family protein, partial [Solemya velum gill symbiont]
LLERIKHQNGFTAAICAAPKVLATAGLLDGCTVTAYPGVLDAVELPDSKVSGAAVEIDGKVITSRGPGTAMDFALNLIEQLLGEEKRQEVEAALVR